MKPRKDSADKGAGSGCMARLVRFFISFRGESEYLTRLPRLGANFGKRLFGRLRVSARAVEDYLLPPWESDANTLEHLVLASGAKWERQGDPAWNLVESAGLENKAAVCELLDHFGVPTFLLDRGEKELALRLDEVYLSLLECGLGISVEHVKRPYCRECTERQIEAIQWDDKCGTKTERCDPCEQCKDGNMSLGLLEPAVDDNGNLHSVANGKHMHHWKRYGKALSGLRLKLG